MTPHSASTSLSLIESQIPFNADFDRSLSTAPTFGIAETGVFSPEDLYSPEVLAGLNPLALQRVFETPEKQAALVEIFRTRPEGEDFDRRLRSITGQLPPEVLAGLNPEAILSVAADPEKTAQFQSSLEKRPAFDRPNIFERITGGISAAAGQTVATTRRAIQIFLFLVFAVVILVVVIAFRQGAGAVRGLA